ncbi:M56 family metallopeptidase [Nonomuraea sp. NPDC050536]|uniref:M56 family metallopeptidase n=1 Tax=Nonomuraea sp. NPDC050536 TaxID=3364366 RepID=UPI0037C87EA6
MTVAAILAAYTLVAATLLPRLLARAAWAERAPRPAICMWLAAGLSTVGSAVLAGLSAAIPGDAVGHGLARLFEACGMLLGDGSGVEVASATFRLAVLASGLVAARAAYCVAGVLLTARRERARHAGMLAILGRRDGELDAVVLEYGEPLAYCLPGRQNQAVITTAALRALPPEHVAAVLAHERAHLRGRHHLVIALAEGLARAFPWLPLFAVARREVARLVELRADDVAAGQHPRAHLAAALVGLATGRVPAFALGAAGENALVRVRRMLNPAAPLHRRERAVAVAATALFLAGPAAIAFAPGVAALVAHHCHTLLPL